MQHRQLLLIQLALCLLLGCGDQTPSGNDGNSQTPSSELAARLQAAKAIQTTHEHDTALADLAKDAARAGDGDVAKAAIDAIRTDGLHDTAAADTATLLAKGGRTDDAVSVAKLIKTDSLRDQTWAKIAKED